MLPEWGRRGEGEAYAACLRALPEADLCNGFFVALLERHSDGSHPASSLEKKTPKRTPGDINLVSQLFALAHKEEQSQSPSQEETTRKRKKTKKKTLEDLSRSSQHEEEEERATDQTEMDSTNTVAMYSKY